MSLYRSLLRPIAFKFDPERIHEFALSALSRGLVKAGRFEDRRLCQDLFGVHFPNPLGLAAGFDKNGLAIPHWPKLGFGFVEVGTVTYHAQPGNEKPRMFRVPEANGLINRLGFNNLGSAALAKRLTREKSPIPLGINLGKSKITELANAAADYGDSYRLLHTFGDYFVVNVSSPNTPGLRTLQDKSALTDIVSAMREIDGGRPIFVKIAPDLEASAIDEVVTLASDQHLTGIVATNTTIDRTMLATDPGQAGGLSGLPLQKKSNEILAYVFRNSPRDLVLIGVGGIMDGDSLYDKIACGAHLCQVYTGWIYGGPSFVPTALRRLVERLDEDGIDSLAQLRGTRTSTVL
jgi:dihydroorotate dehydrogenase